MKSKGEFFVPKGNEWEWRTPEAKLGRMDIHWTCCTSCDNTWCCTRYQPGKEEEYLCAECSLQEESDAG